MARTRILYTTKITEEYLETFSNFLKSVQSIIDESEEDFKLSFNASINSLVKLGDGRDLRDFEPGFVGSFKLKANRKLRNKILNALNKYFPQES